MVQSLIKSLLEKNNRHSNDRVDFVHRMCRIDTTVTCQSNLDCLVESTDCSILYPFMSSNVTILYMDVCAKCVAMHFSCYKLCDTQLYPYILILPHNGIRQESGSVTWEDNRGVPPLKRRGGTGITASEIEQAEEFNGQLTDVFNKNDHSELSFLSRSAPFMDDIVVSNEGVTKLLKGLNPSKA